MRYIIVFVGLVSLSLSAGLLYKYFPSTNNVGENSVVTVPKRDLALNGSDWSIKGVTTNRELKGSVLDSTHIRSSSWYKPLLVNGCNNTNLFPYPYNLVITPNSIGVGIPSILGGENAVIASKNYDISIDYVGSTCSIVDSQDPLVSRFQFGNVNIASGKGLGYILITSTDYITLNLDISLSRRVNDNLVILTSNLALVTNKPTKTTVSGTEIQLDFSSLGDNVAAVFYYPNESALTDISNKIYFEAPKSTVTYSVNEDRFSQEFMFERDTLMYLLPHHYSNLLNSPLGLGSSLLGLRGTQKLYYSNSYLIGAELVRPPFMPNMDISSEIRTKLANTLPVDLKGVSHAINDETGVYWKGKSLFKAVNLLYLANLLSYTDTDFLLNELEAEISDWFNYSGDTDTKYYYYDLTYGGVLSNKPEYGHETYNDHHLQYGYWVYALNYLIQNYPERFNKFSEPLEYIINSTSNFSSEDFPYLRHFDSYEGKSYASGLYYFADGNNQESSSEALNYYYSAYIWANHKSSVSDNSNYYSVLAKKLLSLYNLELLSTKYYFFNKDSLVFSEPYIHSSVGIVWEGKYDYATWFSADPNAILGIQVFPVTFFSNYVLDIPGISGQINQSDQKSWEDILRIYRSAEIDGIFVTDPSLSYDSMNSSSWSIFITHYLHNSGN